MNTAGCGWAAAGRHTSTLTSSPSSRTAVSTTEAPGSAAPLTGFQLPFSCTRRTDCLVKCYTFVMKLKCYTFVMKLGEGGIARRGRAQIRRRLKSQVLQYSTQYEQASQSWGLLRLLLTMRLRAQGRGTHGTTCNTPAPLLHPAARLACAHRI